MCRCMCGCGLGCCLIPLCIDSLKNTKHVCPNCRRVVGYRRLPHSHPPPSSFPPFRSNVPAPLAAPAPSVQDALDTPKHHINAESAERAGRVTTANTAYAAAARTTSVITCLSWNPRSFTPLPPSLSTRACPPTRALCWGKGTRARWLQARWLPSLPPPSGLRVIMPAHTLPPAAPPSGLSPLADPRPEVAVGRGCCIAIRSVPRAARRRRPARQSSSHGRHR